MWRVAFLLVLVFLPKSGWAQGYQSKELAEAAAAGCFFCVVTMFMVVGFRPSVLDAPSTTR